MSDENGHNGWTNYETWAWNLWLTNDQESQEHVYELARVAYTGAEVSKGFTREGRAALDLAAMLRVECEEEVPDLELPAFADLLNAAIGEINWYEIAKHLIENMDQDEPKAG